MKLDYVNYPEMSYIDNYSDEEQLIYRLKPIYKDEGRVPMSDYIEIQLKE